MISSLPELERRVRHDLACLNFPAPNWVPPIDGVLDVLIVGAGMCGQTAAYATLREGVRSLRIIDRAPEGREGPWGTFARMPTLRSPKHLTGPDLGVPSLTFRAWYEAQHGAQGWAALYKVARLDWRDYLLWVRRMVGVPVENDTALQPCAPAKSCSPWGAMAVAHFAGPSCLHLTPLTVLVKSSIRRTILTSML